MKILLTVMTILIVLLAIAWLYLTFKVWSIFGFWRMVATTLGLIISGIFLGRLSKAKRIEGDKIIFNPKEWPKFLQMISSLLIGYYLLTVVQQQQLGAGDYTFSIAYLVLTIAIPILWSMYALARDRNDFMEFNGTNLMFRDNSHTGRYDMTNLEKIEAGKNLNLSFKDGKTENIAWSNMNFSLVDKLQIQEELEKFIPKKEETKA